MEEVMGMKMKMVLIVVKDLFKAITDLQKFTL